MQLPFTREEFFDLLAAYNTTLWPALVALWLASVLAAIWLALERRPSARWISGLLVVHWAWSAVAYHLAFFTRINPAAWLFAAMFLLQAAVLFWIGVVRGRLSFTSPRAAWAPMGWFLVAYALVYPVLSAAEHGSVVRIPAFGVPCPTTIFTAGLLLLATPGTRTLAVIPIIWCAIGGSAAFLLGVSADYGLLLAGALLVVFEIQKSPTSSSAVAPPVEPPHIDGTVSRGFEAVQRAFTDNFARRGELGGACCAYHRGEKVVDLWGGIRNKQTGEPWEPDTMVVIHSATKGLAAMTLAIAHSRGWLDYEEGVAHYWPEFAQHGKERITVRQLLAHQAGLFAIDEPVDRTVVADLDRLAAVLARQKPAWEPGTRQGYHALTLGFYEGELLRRVDPQHRSLARFFQDEIAAPLGLDLYLRLPETVPNARLATIASPGRMEMLRGFPLRFALEAVNPRSNIYRALVVNPGAGVYIDEQRIYARDLEVPSGNAVGTARAIARAYAAFASGGRELGLRKETLDLLAAPAIPPTNGFHDECLKGEVQFSLGFMKPCATWPFGSPSSFGSPGSGGALGFADPSVGVGYAYVTSLMGTTLTGDPRDIALRDALYSALPALPGMSIVAA